MKIFIDGQNCRITEVETLVAGSQKQYIAETHFTSEWDRYIKFIVFSNNRMVGKDMMMEVNEDGTVEVPWEILVPAGQLRVGAYGVDGQYRRPTLWSAPKVLNFGTDAGEIGREPTVTPWERILRQIGDPMDLETEDRETVVGAVNEVLRRIPSHLADLTGDSEHRTVSDAEKAAWSGKQDTISDIDAIRHNAEQVPYKQDIIPDLETIREQAAEVENKAGRDEIPAKMSDLENDEGFITTEEAPVQSVNGMTGDVEITPETLGLGRVFDLKGSVATVNDLPQTGNRIGDVYYVSAESVGYVWIDHEDTERWEQLGIAIDLDTYQTKAITDTEGDFEADTVEGALHELAGFIDGINTALAGKQSTISDLAQIRAGAAKGATALQEITGSDVTEALGYTPADDEDMSQVYDSITDISETVEGVDDRVKTLEEKPEINAVRLADDGKIKVVTPPTSTKWTGNIGIGTDGSLILATATQNIINNRSIGTATTTGSSQFVPVGQMDYAVKALMTDGKGAAWTDEEQKAARSRIGVEQASFRYYTEFIHGVELDARNKPSDFETDKTKYFYSDFGVSKPIFRYKSSETWKDWSRAFKAFSESEKVNLFKLTGLATEQATSVLITTISPNQITPRSLNRMATIKLSNGKNFTVNWQSFAESANNPIYGMMLIAPKHGYYCAESNIGGSGGMSTVYKGPVNALLIPAENGVFIDEVEFFIYPRDIVFSDCEAYRVFLS